MERKESELSCSAPACDRPILAKGLCRMHYQRMRTNGSLDALYKPTPMERFMRFVQKSETCWLWTGAKCNSFGHGRFDNSSAHRASWKLFRGPIPFGLHVLHRCDNPPCVNPNHLFVGTARDNILDCIAKGRRRNNAPKGENHSDAILTESQVLEIRKLRALGFNNPQLAEKYGVSRENISAIATRRTWKHI